MDFTGLIQEKIRESIEVKRAFLSDEKMIKTIQSASREVINAFRKNKKVLLCGNGGSAADAQHIAAELSGRFYFDRKPLDAEALHVNTSYLTAISNDYSYDEVFSRLVTAKGQKGDILISISTSGNSINILKAIEEANRIGMINIGFTGERGGKMNGKCKHLVKVPSSDTPRIQETHILIGHIICEIAEKALFPKKG